MTKKKAYLLLAGIAAITVLCLLQLPKLKFDYDFDNFFPMDDSNWVSYQDYTGTFGYDNDYLLIAIDNHRGIFNSNFLGRIDLLIEKFKSVQGITRIISPLDAKKIVKTPLSVVSVPYLHLKDESKLKKDSILLGSHPNFAHNLINQSATSLALVVYHDRYPDKTIESELSQSIEKIIRDSQFDDYHMAGRIKAQFVFISLIRDNFLLFLGLSSVLIIVVLYLMFRRIRWVLIPLLIIAVSVAVSLAGMVLSNKSIDILSSMLPTILLVVAMSDITHFLTRYFDLCAKQIDHKKALALTLREVGIATLLTSVTTAIGFATLAVTDSIPVKNLGIYTAMGVLITYVITICLFTSVSTLSNSTRISEHHGKWKAILDQLLIRVLRQRFTVLIIYFILFMVSLYGVSKIKVDTMLISDFPIDHKVTRDFRFFDQQFEGSKPFEVSIRLSEEHKSVFEPYVLEEIDKVQSFLKQEYETSNLVSPADLVKALNMSQHGGQPEYYGLPESKREYRYVNRELSRARYYFPLNLVTDDHREARITGFTKDVGSKMGMEQANRFQAFLKEEISVDGLDFRLTGTSYLFDMTTDSLVSNIIYGLSLAIAMVGLIMAILFRSIRMIFIAMIPNLIPILFLAAFMGITGIPLRLSTSIIFAIAFGIAVDDTIHFLSKFKLELNRGVTSLTALVHTFRNTGKAIIITTIILAAGFTIFTFSSFQATFYTGLLISITLLVAVITDLTLLPILLLILRKDNVSRSK